MTVNSQFRGDEWFNFYPIQKLLSKDSTVVGTQSKSQTLLVDIGGGIGHDLAALRNAHPGLELVGRLVLQDLPQTIERAKLNPELPANTLVMSYNMFERQPIQDAKVYYFRTVLHDWPDKEVLLALKNVRDAMAKRKDRPILLLNENIMPAREPGALAPLVDFVMMNCYASLERTELQWYRLLEKAGFEVVKIWEPGDRGKGMIALFEATCLSSSGFHGGISMMGKIFRVWCTVRLLHDMFRRPR